MAWTGVPGWSSALLHMLPSGSPDHQFKNTAFVPQVWVKGKEQISSFLKFAQKSKVSDAGSLPNNLLSFMYLT